MEKVNCDPAPPTPSASHSFPPSLLPPLPLSRTLGPTRAAHETVQMAANVHAADLVDVIGPSVVALPLEAAVPGRQRAAHPILLRGHRRLRAPGPAQKS